VVVPTALGPNSTIERTEGWVVETLGADVVMLEPERDRYLRLNRTGALLWSALEEPATVTELVQRLAEAEGISPERAREDTVAFVTDLIEHGAARTT
jgi:hypothetical protein